MNQNKLIFAFIVPFKIRMEIPQSLFDEGIKNSGHIDEISVVHPHSGYYAELMVKQSKKFEFKI